MRLDRAFVEKRGVLVASAAETSERGGSFPPVTTTQERPSEKKPRAATLRASGVSESRYESSVSPST